MKSFILTIFLTSLLAATNGFAQKPKPGDGFSDMLMDRLHELQKPHYDAHRRVSIVGADTFEYSHATEFILNRYRINISSGELHIYREDRGVAHSNKEYYFKPFPLKSALNLTELKTFDLEDIQVRAGCDGALSVLGNLMDTLEDAMEDGADSSSSYIESLVRAVTRALHDFLSCVLH